jgi:Queuine/archaeosine tRNA-ribosyltransferase
LLKIKDPLGPMLISLHNLNYYFNLMTDLGVSIEEGRLDSFREDFYKDN